MNVGDLVWVKTELCGKQLAILLEPLDWTYEGSIWLVQRFDKLELYGRPKPEVCFPYNLGIVNESR